MAPNRGAQQVIAHGVLRGKQEGEAVPCTTMVMLRARVQGAACGPKGGRGQRQKHPVAQSHAAQSRSPAQPGSLTHPP